MGDLSDAVLWWDESQLRFLVIASLCIQYILTVFAVGRKHSVPSWFRFGLWLSYLGNDALAIYALATLFNRQKKLSYLDGSRALEILWAPILLMHLGGQIFITAYNVEDNELWTRHIVTASSQVAVALYIFFKLWSFTADNKLRAAAILLFIPGIIKCFTKPWALKLASFNSLADSLDHAKRTTTVNREEELKKYVQDARACVLVSDPPSPPNGLLKMILDAIPQPRLRLKRIHYPEELFVDFSYSYSDRLNHLRSFCLFDDAEAFCELRDGFSHVFDLLYTKSKITSSGRGCTGREWGGFLTWLLNVFLPAAATILFHTSHKKPVQSDDINLTFVLLYSAIALEFFSMIIIGAFGLSWIHTVPQRSILGQIARSKRHDKLKILATHLRCKDLLDQHWSMKSCYSAMEITELVRVHVREGWKAYICDAESYREFNDIRGQWTLEREQCHIQLNWSLEKPFDESILLWHIATDLCYQQMDSYPFSRRRCREISNYMMHLLIVNPEMLMPGSRRSLFAIAYSELEAIAKGEDTLMDENNVAKKVIKQMKSAQDNSTKETFIYDAWLLSEGLMSLDIEKRWRVIQGVWLEMMCFSAGRCRGFLHAKALGSGGQYLSYVWLLLAYFGMETSAERVQRTQKLNFSEEKRKRLQTEDQDVASASAFEGTEQEITASPETSQGDSAMEIVVSA